MKFKYILFLGLLWAVFDSGNLHAQQIPISLNYIFRPDVINPASVGVREYNNVIISHQQRKIAVAGWRSISQFVHYNSQPLGRHGNWGWGLNLVNDIEHTENRINMSGSIAVQAMQTKKSRLSFGANFGFINWNSNYTKVNIFDRTDELLTDSPNFLELDLGAGVEYAMTQKKLQIQAGANVAQLAGNFLSNQLNGLRINPHLFAGGSVLFSPVHNLFVGPAAFYKEVSMRQDTTLRTGVLDVGLKGKLDRQKMWGGASYRINRAALNVAIGMEIYVADTAGRMDHSGVFADLNAGFSMPLQSSSVFGPSFEIGLDISWGKPYKNQAMIDTVRFTNGSFWKNDGNLNRHLEDYLLPNGPPGLRGETRVGNTTVNLDYEFSDQSLQYCGTTPEIVGDSLKKLGMEWIGVDGFLEGIANAVISEALDPDSTHVINVDSLEPLKGITSIQLEAFLQANEEEVNYGAEGTIYEGELGTNNPTDDTLFLKVVYNGADTLVAIAKNHYVTNLELACLKLHSMRMKLQYELEQTYGETTAFVWEGEDIDARQISGKKPVTVRKLRVTPNHPHQDAFQVNRVTLRFSKRDRRMVNEDGDVIPNDIPKTKKKKRKRRGMSRRERR